MAKDESAAPKKEYVYLAPTCPKDNEADYAYGFTVFNRKAEGNDPGKVVKAEIIFPGPKDLSGLEETPAFQFMKERYDLNPRGVFMQALGRMATGPAYTKSETDDEAELTTAHNVAQSLADEFKVGQRKTSATALVKAKAAEAEQVEKEAGMSMADLLAAVKAGKLKIKK